ncbi:MAG TPA: hypothetical protein VGL42_04560 [Opitutaceae bacterium]|jgi:cell division protein FtsQ
MSKSPASLPVARTWRDIPQQVKPRALSREGRRRVTWRSLRVLGGLAALGFAGFAAWQISVVVQSGAGEYGTPRLEPIGDRVSATTDGVLDRAWVMSALALPARATLADAQPAILRARLLAGGQVAAADIERHFPRTLAVHLSERTPVARIKAALGAGEPQTYLVARDGVVYAGHGYDPAMVGSLPWLAGVHPVPGGPGIARIDGMPVAAEFLARAELDAQHLYQTWRIVSLDRLPSDGLIEVRTAQNTAITFSTAHEDEFAQLARLDTILDSVPKGSLARIDLSLGEKVPVAARPAASPPTLQ